MAASDGGQAGSRASRRRSRPPADRRRRRRRSSPSGPPRRPLGASAVALDSRGGRRTRTRAGATSLVEHAHPVDSGGDVDARRMRSRPDATSCTASSTSRSPGRSASCPSASGRSTSTASTRTSASSCRSSSRRCSRATSRRRPVLDPFAGSGTTLVQALESGRDATGVDVAAFNCLLMRGQDAGAQPRRARARRARRAGAARGVGPSGPTGYVARVVRAPGRRGALALPVARRRLRARPTCCASSSPARRVRRGGRRTSTSTSRARRRSASTGATSTGGPAGRSRRPSVLSPLHARHARADQAFADVRAPRRAARRPPRRCA